jgi:hypothetical protein
LILFLFFDRLRIVVWRERLACANESLVFGKIIGPPWTQDEKTAALAGLMVCDEN